MKKVILPILLFLVIASSLTALDLQHSKVFSFTHFLCGNSGIFQRGCSLNPFIWKARSGKELTNHPEFIRLIALVRKSAESFKNTHRFECAFYKAGIEATDIGFLARFLADTTGEDPQFCSDLLSRVYNDFTRYFYPDEDLIDSDLNGLKSSRSFLHFSTLLDQQKSAFAYTGSELNIKIGLIPVYASSEEFTRFKNSGKFSIFGLSLDEVQLIEVPLIQGAPEITSRATVHLNAVALHEINHFLYHDSDFYKLSKEFFKSSKYENARLAGSYFNETLATACGQGMAQLVYQTDDPQWYDNRVINRLAHEFFNVARQYLEQEKKFDKDFLQSYLEMFEKVYPDARLVPEIAFTRFSLSFPGIEGSNVPASKIKKTLKKFLPMYRIINVGQEDNETLIIEIFLRKPSWGSKNNRGIKSNNILYKHLFFREDKFIVYRQFSDSYPAKITFILDSEKDFLRAAASLFKLSKFKPIMKL